MMALAAGMRYARVWGMKPPGSVRWTHAEFGSWAAGESIR